MLTLNVLPRFSSNSSDSIISKTDNENSPDTKKDVDSKTEPKRIYSKLFHLQEEEKQQMENKKNGFFNVVHVLHSPEYYSIALKKNLANIGNDAKKN